MASILLRHPTTSLLEQPSGFVPPSLEFLAGTWHVTHSTLPMWKTKRNVSITYREMARSTASSSSGTTDHKLEDTVSYQTLSSDKTKTIVGVDTIAKSTGEWDWRGKGWLMIASSHWEVLGHGQLDGEGEWVVTYFAKTMFTPAGIDIYARQKQGHSQQVLESIKRALKNVQDESINKLADELFEVTRN